MSETPFLLIFIQIYEKCSSHVLCSRGTGVYFFQIITKVIYLFQNYLSCFVQLLNAPDFRNLTKEEQVNKLMYNSLNK